MGKNKDGTHRRCRTVSKISLHPINWIKELTSTTDRERYEPCWDPRSANWKLVTTLTKLSKPEGKEPLYKRAIQGHLGGAVQPNFIMQETFPNIYKKELYHIGYCEDARHQ